jgi:hypothetical protein
MHVKVPVHYTGVHVVSENLTDTHRSYLLFDSITPTLRGFVSILLVFTGFAFQLSFHNLLAGLPFIIICGIFNLFKGVSVGKVVPKKLKWEIVTPEKIAQVADHCARIKSFRSGSVGCIVFMIVFFVVISFGMPLLLTVLLVMPFPLVATVVNAFVLFGGMALSGRKSAWMPYALDVKISVVKNFLALPSMTDDPTIEIMPYLEMGQSTDGQFPNDARFMVRLKDAPKDFIGLQGQISINAVKGKAYPYFYVVVLAKPEFKLFERFTTKKIEKCVIERKKTGEVDVIVIRQYTTKTSGYHTNTDMQRYILERGIKSVKSMLV